MKRIIMLTVLLLILGMTAVPSTAISAIYSVQDYSSSLGHIALTNIAENYDWDTTSWQHITAGGGYWAGQITFEITSDTGNIESVLTTISIKEWASWDIMLGNIKSWDSVDSYVSYNLSGDINYSDKIIHNDLSNLLYDNVNTFEIPLMTYTIYDFDLDVIPYFSVAGLQPLNSDADAHLWAMIGSNMEVTITDVHAVSEPSVILLFASGIAGLLAGRKIF